MHTVPPNALVVVADGTGARVFRNQGDGRAVSLHQFQLLELMNMNDDGPAGSVPDGATGYQIDKATFAKQLAQRLNDTALKGAYDDLVLIADEKTLGEMRPLLHKEVQDRLRIELGKNLTNVPLEEIERELS